MFRLTNLKYFFCMLSPVWFHSKYSRLAPHCAPHSLSLHPKSAHKQLHGKDGIRGISWPLGRTNQWREQNRVLEFYLPPAKHTHLLKVSEQHHLHVQLWPLQQLLSWISVLASIHPIVPSHMVLLYVYLFFHNLINKYFIRSCLNNLPVDAACSFPDLLLKSREC